MKIIKKNQLTILVLALMLVTAGYLNYNSNQTVTTEGKVASIGDATLVSSNSVISENNTTNSKNVVAENNTISENSITNNTVSNTNTTTNTTSNTVNTNAQASKNKDYFSSSKLERDTMYSQMLESYQKILDSTTTSSKQKEAAQKEITSINNTKNAIMISENLIKTKGFNDCIVYSNDESINIVIDKEELSKEDTAQIQSIIAREMNAKLENIHIMNK